MSVKNLYSSLEKPYQSLNLNSLSADALNVQNETINSLQIEDCSTPILLNQGDFSMPGGAFNLAWVNNSSLMTLPSNVFSGVIEVSNLPNVPLAGEAIFIVSNGFVGETLILVECDYMENYPGTSYTCTVKASGGGNFDVVFRNPYGASILPLGTIRLSFLILRIKIP